MNKTPDLEENGPGAQNGEGNEKGDEIGNDGPEKCCRRNAGDAADHEDQHAERRCQAMDHQIDHEDDAEMDGINAGGHGGGQQDRPEQQDGRTNVQHQSHHEQDEVGE